jgi:hypothetical protein
MLKSRRDFLVATIGFGAVMLVGRRGAAMTAVNLTNASTIAITTSLVSGNLQLSVGGTPLGPLIDTFTSSSPPATVRVSVKNLPSGASITAQWQPWSGGTWTAFVTDSTGSHYDFPVPALGMTTQVRIQAHNGSGAASNTQFVLRASSEAGY